MVIKMNEFKLNLDQNSLVYFPIKSNKPLELKKSLSFSDMFIIEVDSKEFLVTNEGKMSIKDKYPSVFPYTLDWFNTLLTLYPSLEPYKEDKYFYDYNSVTKILFQIHKHVLCVVSPIDYQHALCEPISMKHSFETFKFHVPINPYTLKPCKTIQEYYAYE